MKCHKCKKQLKEDTEGNPKYCQGHDMFESFNGLQKFAHTRKVGDLKSK